jgi:hypothetical protein
VQELNNAVSDPDLQELLVIPTGCSLPAATGTPNSMADSSVESVSRTHLALFADQERRAVALTRPVKCPMTVPAAAEPRDCVDAASVRFPPGEHGMVRTYAGTARL